MEGAYLWINGVVLVAYFYLGWIIHLQKGHLIVGGCMSTSHVQIPFKSESSISQNSVVLTCAC